MILNFLIVLILINAVLPEDCYWKGWPWCHYVWYGYGVTQDLDQYCCPAVNYDIVLCEQKDYLGNCITQRVPRNKCVQVINKWSSSANTSGKCFRLYEHADCTGKSIALQPGQSFHNYLDHLDMSKVSAVSRCFTSDLCANDKKSPDAYKLGCQWGNKLFYIGNLTWLPFDTENLGNGPVLWYQTGHFVVRAEVVHAHIQKHHIGSGSEADENAELYATDMGFTGDEPGLILPKRLGGSGTDMRNIFPRSKNFNRMEWAHVIDNVEKFVSKYDSAYFTVNLAYHHVSETRPYLLLYQIRPGNGSLDEFLINNIVNTNP